MSGFITVRGIRAEGRHGLRAAGEREVPQPFVVDVEVRVDVGRAASADRLEHTVDYDDVARSVRKVIESESFELVETMALAIADRVVALGAVAVRVRVSKPRAAESMAVDEVAVTVERGDPW